MRNSRSAAWLAVMCGIAAASALRCGSVQDIKPWPPSAEGELDPSTLCGPSTEWRADEGKCRPASMPDAGVEVDAGVDAGPLQSFDAGPMSVDASVPDASVPDASTTPDANIFDSGPATDSGIVDPSQFCGAGTVFDPLRGQCVLASVDGGSFFVDAGPVQSFDAGPIQVDAGPAADAGSVSVDAGSSFDTGGADAGPVSVDAGSALVDAGPVQSFDAGSVSVDAGIPSMTDTLVFTWVPPTGTIVNWFVAQCQDPTCGQAVFDNSAATVALSNLAYTRSWNNASRRFRFNASIAPAAGLPANVWSCMGRNATEGGLTGSFSQAPTFGSRACTVGRYFTANGCEDLFDCP